MQKRWLVLGLIILLMFSLIISGCVTKRGYWVERLASFDQQKINKVLYSVAPRYQIPEGWKVGVILQKTWQENKGLGADPYNKVRLIVQTKEALEIIVPEPAAEAWAVENLNAGDLITYEAKYNYYRESRNHYSFNYGAGDIIVLSKGQQNKLYYYILLLY